MKPHGRSFKLSVFAAQINTLWTGVGCLFLGLIINIETSREHPAVKISVPIRSLRPIAYALTA